MPTPAPSRWQDGKLELPDEPTGDQTAIGAALDDVLRREREASKRLLGVILLSDGAQRAYAPHDLAPQMPARRLADRGAPLFALSFGQGRGLGQVRDVAVKDLIVNPTVYVKNELSVEANVRVDGLVNQDIPLQLLFEGPGGKMQTVATQELHPAKDGASLGVEMSYVPTVPGEYKLTVRAEKQPGEVVTTNNELSTFVTVLKGGLNVLYIEGALRVEQKFLRRSLDASADIKVDYVRLTAPDKQKPRTLDLVPLFARGKYDVYILGDIDHTWFRDGELAALANVVHQGAGLCMLGGLHTFAPGGYFEVPPLAELLPIVMNEFDRQPQGEAILPQLHIAGPVQMLPNRRLGTKHFTLQLGPPQANAAVWQKLPPLEGANKFDRLKPSAQVLAETPDGKPLMVAGEAGGRVLALAVDSTWRWWLAGFATEHKRFWRQVILWLARKDEQSEGNVWVKLGQRRAAPGGRVELTAGAKSPQGDVYSDAELTAEVILPDGTTRRTVHLSHAGDELAGIFRRHPSGGRLHGGGQCRPRGRRPGHGQGPVPGLRAGPGAGQRRGRSQPAGQPGQGERAVGRPAPAARRPAGPDRPDQEPAPGARSEPRGERHPLGQLAVLRPARRRALARLAAAKKVGAGVGGHSSAACCAECSCLLPS